MPDKMSKPGLPSSRRPPQRPMVPSQEKSGNIWQRLSTDGKVATVIGTIGLVIAFFTLVPGPWHASEHTSDAVPPVREAQPKQTQPEGQSPDDPEPKPKLKYVPLPQTAPREQPNLVTSMPSGMSGTVEIPKSAIEFKGGLVPVLSAKDARNFLQNVNEGHVFNGKKLNGPIALYVDIGESGAVRDVQIVSGDEKLAEQAKEAVKQWKFKPFVENGAPASAQRVIVFGASPGG